MKILITVMLCSFIYSQETDIYFFDLVVDKNMTKLRNMKNITDREGYDNQPSFSPDGLILYYSSDNEKSAPDIYSYHVESGKETQLTDTFEKEYSPLVMPDGKHISFVQQYRRIQALVKMNLETKEITEISKKLNNVGYHCWINDNIVAIFEANSPPTLHIVNIEENEDEEIDEYVGRSIYINPVTKKLNFFNYDDEKGTIFELNNISSDEKKAIISMKANSHDFFIMSDGTILSTLGSIIYSFKEGKDENWNVFFDGQDKGINEITRVTVNPQMTKIAIVSTVKR